MSFRKRSVKPNLNLSKRPAPALSFKQLVEKEKEAEDDNGDLKTLDDAQLAQEQPSASLNVSSTADTKLPVETKDTAKEKKSSDSPTLGKRLSKRTKVAPKVTLQKKTSVGKASPAKPCLQTPAQPQIPLSMPDYQETDDNAPVSPALPLNTSEITSPIQSCVDNTSINNKTSSEEPTSSVNIDVMKAYKLIRDGNMAEINREIDKDKREIDKEINREIDKDKTSAVGKDVSDGSVIVSTKSSKTETVKGNRLSKRTRVMPKLTSKTVNKENKDSVSKDNDNKVVNSASDKSSCDNNSKQLETKDNTAKCSETAAKPSTLQRRVKARPNLKSRTNASCASPKDEKEHETQNSKLERNETVSTQDTEKCLNDTAVANNERTLTSLQTISNECDRILSESERRLCSVGVNNNNNNNTVSTNEKLNNVNDDFSSNNYDRSISDDVLTDRKELKHVRFTSNDYNDNYRDTDSNFGDMSPTGCSPDTDETNALKLPNSTEHLLGRCDSNDDYDSMSDGETLGKQLESKNKVFKPNLGAKRRERLSSFSAYSSCDEEDWQNPKKKKKEKGKKQTEDADADEKDQTKTEEKKRKPKTISKPKKDRENLEPNAGMVEKKKKKKEKPLPVAKKQPKYEERDLSTLTMQELIHYSNPSFKTVELRSKREEDENEHVLESGSIAPSAPDETKPSTDKMAVENEVMAPQIMINEDGEIVINQESLTISQTVDDSILKKSGVVYEDSLSYGNHLKRKHNSGKRWSIEETLRFYKALSEIGTDFTLMSQAFGRFTRNELKKKFKKEEKVNCDLVDRALSNRLPLNMEMFLRGKEEMKDHPDDDKTGDAVVPDDAVVNDAEAIPVECEGES